MLKDHLGNIRVLYGNPFEGNNLVENSDCNTIDFFPPVQNVTQSLETIEGESYIKFVANQTWSTPGMLTQSISVKAGEKYTYKVKGYRANHPASGAYLYVYTSTGDLLWPGAKLPYGRENETWVSSDFTIPDGVTAIQLGVLWTSGDGLAVGDVFYLNEVALFKHRDDDYIGGFEVSDQEHEFDEFSNYHPTKINTSGAYSRTGTSAYRLTGSTQVSNEVVGAAKSLRVFPGDAVYLEVYGRYLTATGNGTDVGSVIAGALQNAFGLSAGGATDVAYQSIGNLFGEGAIIGTTAYAVEDEVSPKAFLNYILFDDDYVPYDFGYDQIETTGAIPGSSSDRMNLVAKVQKPGYIYIYISNENDVEQEVYFDDLAIKHVKGVAIQQNDYYPFGLTFNSYQRENSVDQRWKFQGQEHIDDLDLGWDSFKWRNYMPDIGRFFNVDPLAPKYVYNSPYAFSENHVTSHIELEGLEKVSIHVRHFIPEARAGGGFYRGDNRGFTTRSNVTSRVSHTVTVDTQTKGFSTSTVSSPTKFYPAGPLSDKGIERTSAPEVKDVSVSSENKSINVSSEYSAADPLALGAAPDIDFKNSYSITPDYENGSVTVTGATTGDQYPAAESFVSDEAGNRVFVGVAPAEGSIMASYGTGDKNLINNTVRIATDANGNFTGVYGSDGKVIPVDEYNKQYQSTNTSQ